ncbi:ABC-three component system middle component 1 [Poseidonibacter lekithochrous]|uniref:ABC-three component system middle component 1 n=1 Tax=Poseidonibacter lekithochrous TaxID=1904463 RepID=UPI000D381A08|nr:ABC-three component system middle component 1 [Poseidonibacter lekithochrous]
MVNIVCDLFENNDYEKIDLDLGMLFSKKEISGKKDFWFVLEEDDLGLICDKQSEILNQCIESNGSPELNKNISMLILWNTGGELDFVEMKKQIMPIEEDGYYFKKHVLYYAPTELEELKVQLFDINIGDFFNANISNENNFKEYKKNPSQMSWRELFYRLVIKLPFIEINIDNSVDIESLHETIDNSLESSSDNTLLSLNNKIFELYSENSTQEIDNLNIMNVTSNLLVVSTEEENNGN